MTIPQLLLLVGAALAAGFVDAIAGGGGLIAVPSLLAVGLPPHLALGTNKGQSMFGSFAAAIRYARAGLVDPRSARVTFPSAFLGALAGVGLLLFLRPEVLRPLVLILIPAAAVIVTFVRTAPAGSARARPRHGILAAALIALGIGAYDGFFGPGAGTFYLSAFVGFLGLTPSRASADAKIANFASNAAAMAVFASRGLIVWPIALPMALAQLFGGFLGAHVAVRRGDRLIRLVVLFVSLALAVKVARDLYVDR